VYRSLVCCFCEDHGLAWHFEWTFCMDRRIGLSWSNRTIPNQSSYLPFFAWTASELRVSHAAHYYCRRTSQKLIRPPGAKNTKSYRHLCDSNTRSRRKQLSRLPR